MTKTIKEKKQEEELRATAQTFLYDVERLLDGFSQGSPKRRLFLLSRLRQEICARVTNGVADNSRMNSVTPTHLVK